MDTKEDLAILVARLASIPARVAGAVEGWSDAQLHQQPKEDGWSAAEIFAHMRACDDIVAYRVYAILTRDNPPLIAFDERHWAEVVGYAQDDFGTLLAGFSSKRAELVNLLRRITLDDWMRGGTHEEFGPVSLLGLMTHMAGHEEEHCTQIEAIHFN